MLDSVDSTIHYGETNNLSNVFIGYILFNLSHILTLLQHLTPQLEFVFDISNLSLEKSLIDTI